MASKSTGHTGQPSEEDPFFAGHTTQLVLQAPLLEPKKTKDVCWIAFKNSFLQHVCGARNTPNASSTPSSRFSRQDWWRLDIKLEGMKENCVYDNQLYDRIDDQLSHLLSPKSNFADVFLNCRHESKIILDVASSNEDFATLDYKTGQTTNKGLVPASSIGMETVCFHLYEKKSMDSTLPGRCPQLEPPLDTTKPLPLSEDARLQFKRLKTGDPANQKKRGKKGSDVDTFNPKDGKSFVEWIWDKSSRSLGEYVSGFSKVERGGVIYYGIADEGIKGCVLEGFPLQEGWVSTIKEVICHKICHEMLWIQRDPVTEDGYRELTPDDIRYQGETEPAHDQSQTEADQTPSHFAVDFIPVQDPSSSQAKYVLEVRVAPFNGVVFYDPQGPEAYRMEREGGGFKPVRVSKEEWLAKMRDYGWCSTHKISKRNVCAECQSEQSASFKEPSNV